ncbi:MAG: metallophosphoesterase family protein [Marinilabiliales bacterium]|nr:metallophosphoesterase family protein [Marinilabiliales bacterium]
MRNRKLSWQGILMGLGLVGVSLMACQKDKANGNKETPDPASQDVNGYSLILGRPEATSVTVSLLFNAAADVYWEYGTSPGSYTGKTTVFPVSQGVPMVAAMTGLTGDTPYYYRIRYRLSGVSTEFAAGPEQHFHTQRAPGSPFVFTVEADEHLYDKKGVQSIYRICLANQAADHPDFMLSLGDTFGDDHNPFAITSAQLEALHNFYRPFFGSICASVPLLLCLGNHEGEDSYYLGQNPPGNLAVNGTLWRKYYYANPYPDGFYTGNQEIEPWGIGHPENYYAWTWGDALFVVLDVYRYQGNGSAKPEGWDWSLGSTQYGWLKNTLENSHSKFKFVFAHHVRGEGRGAVALSKYYEWGGYEEKSEQYTFPSKRPGWAKPIHQLMVDNHVTLFFQGHDHLFAKEVRDALVYQEVPMPSDSTYQIGYLANADAYTSNVLAGTGHLRVSVSGDGVTVDFIKAFLPADETGGNKNRQTAFSYQIK